MRTADVHAADMTGAYARLERFLAEQRCLILDGATATELGRLVPPPDAEQDEALWGTWALLHAPDAVLDVHRRYVDVGCDVISTNTWGSPANLAMERVASGAAPPAHWMDLARRGVRVGREA